MKLKEKRRVYEKKKINPWKYPWFWKQSVLQSTAANATLKHTAPLIFDKTVDRDIENDDEDDEHGSHGSSCDSTCINSSLNATVLKKTQKIKLTTFHCVDIPPIAS